MLLCQPKCGLPAQWGFHRQCWFLGRPGGPAEDPYTVHVGGRLGDLMGILIRCLGIFMFTTVSRMALGTTQAPIQ